MCGRFTLTIPSYEELAQALGVDSDPNQAAAYRPRFNVAPTDTHWILRMRTGVRALMGADWGLIPHWAKHKTDGGRPINARAETLASSPLFREALAQRRCVVVADGFYEWQKVGNEKRPIWFHPSEGGLLLMAGVASAWTDPSTSLRKNTFSIVTTRANETVAPVHDRMPAVLTTPTDVEAWLDTEARASTADVLALLRPAPESYFRLRAVSKRVGSVKNDDAACLDLFVPSDLAPPVERAKPAPRRDRKPAAENRTLSLFGEGDGDAVSRKRSH